MFSERLGHDPSHAEGIPEHFHGVPHDVHLAPLGIDPLDGAIFDSEAEALSKEEELHVEGESVQRLEGEEGFPGSVAEGFEAALGVAQAQAGDPAEHGIETLAQFAAEEALPFQDGALGVLAVGDEHVELGVLGKMGEEGVDFRQGGGEVGIHKKGDISLGAEHPGAHGVAFAALHLVTDHVKVRLPRGEVPR